MLIDSHCHLDYFTPMELSEVLARAAAAGVGEMVTIGTTMVQSQALLALIEGHDNLWCTVGVHPHHASEAPVPAPEALAELTRHPRVIGIGESGLDYFYDRAPRDVQQENFRSHIRGARLAGLPLAIHARDADADIARILQEEFDDGGEFAFLLHCFSSSRALAETAIGMGGYVSFSGILTFPRSNELRDIARDLPAERLLVETDAPYLAPVPFRGKRNEPGHVAHTAKVLAEVRGMSPEALGDLTTTNFRRLFGKTGLHAT
jgi:TatD DNase family protein